MTDAPVHVAVAVIQDEQGRTLLAKRPDDSHQGGLWEFPGGKVETGETLLQALSREVCEELNIRIKADSCTPLIKIQHDYGDKQVLLDVWHVSQYDGAVRGNEGQAVQWCDADTMADLSFPAANKPILKALRLPSEYVITGRHCGVSDFSERLHSALEAGARLIMVRDTQASSKLYEDLARVAVEHSRNYGARVMVRGDAAMVKAVGADGLHLTRQQLMQTQLRPLPSHLWVSASCHDPEELAQAARLKLDFATLSPVLHTRSHPEAEPLGWDCFEQWVTSANLPVYALGGQSPALEAVARQRGGQGVAGISHFWPGLDNAPPTS